MREFWVRIAPGLKTEKKRKLVENTSRIAGAYVVESDDIELVRENCKKSVVSPGDKGDIVLLKDPKDISRAKKKDKDTCMNVTITSKEDEKHIELAASLGIDFVIAACPDWKVIPLENLIAEIHGKCKLLALVLSSEEAETALGALEIGVDGIVAGVSDEREIMKIYERMQSVKTRTVEIESAEKVALVPARITELRNLSSGARVCVDTCDLMRVGEGLLVGCQSSGLFLIESEVHETPFVAPRPFRVNAGSIALYVLTPRNKTRYLSELKAGDEVLVVDRNGKTRITNICRVKIEWRPLSLIEAEHEGKKIRTIIQNAETIRIVTEEGSKSAKDLTIGDRVLAHIEEGGRHFGTLIKEEKVIER